MRKMSFALSAVCFGVALAGASTAFAYSGEQYGAKAKITMDQATAIALKAQPGTITDKEIEKESGGSGLRYSFDVKSGSASHEVGIDAISGKILENSVEGKNPD